MECVMVLDVDSSATSFFVHYQGWNKKWDEWVGKDRLLKHNEENLEKQKALEKQHPLEMITMSGRVFLRNPKSPQNHNETRGKKRKRISEGAASYDKLFNIQVPTKLIKHLVSYCEYVTQMGKLVKLPCSPNVDDILNVYLEHQSNKDGRASESAGEILNGLRCYFNKALPAMLLYKCEIQQYEEATANNVSPSQIYGAEHLLRLFVKLPEILSHANIEDETLAVLQHRLQDFLKFLKKNQSSIFLSTYETQDGSCTTE
ncbi:protein MRG1-like isoform X2 [Rutidosis leptorrhynchoides]|uniref:protein MRG1-like isoform X2 n=1 Tax=Rutidosis leptorrhynchoides TaxID=125765 RepID=UPI003A9A4B0B